MLRSASTHTMIAVSDLDAARELYGGTLGLTEIDYRAGSGVRYAAGNGTWFMVYRSQFAGTGKNTCMRFEVDDIEEAVAELRGRGLVFEDYDFPGLKTVDGIANGPDDARGAWFKDPDGDIVEIGQYHR